MNNLVSLVGAGPGDPGLLTLKALERLREADLIVYDYLANPEHLRHAKKGALKIGVGKGFRHKAISQDKINRLIVLTARKGKRVVRLKGGDPYLFGRGGEEALHLEKNKIPFEVVPGVTSATACAAYAGIPLTHRDHNASVTFLTGHRAEDDHLDSIRWEKIASIGGTIVIYMGFYNLEKISGHLIRAGMPGRTPVAVIEWGTLPRQKIIVATLRNISPEVKKSKLAPPCMILIGDVVTLRDRLNWFERLPLFGKKIVITRAPDRAASFREKLAGLGAETLELPLIEINEPDSFESLDHAIGDLESLDWLIFASAYGVEAFFNRLHHHNLDTRALARISVASVGAQTSAALLERGVRADMQPEQFQTEALVKAFKKIKGGVRGKKLLFVRADIAPESFETDLKKMGAVVRRAAAYKTTTPKDIPQDIRQRVRGGEADYAAFTSASTVHGFVKILGKKEARKIAQKTRFLSIGPVTTKTLKSYGFRPFVQAKKFTVDGLLEALIAAEKRDKK